MAFLDEEESKHFLEYVNRESTKEEKEELKRDLEFYLFHTQKHYNCSIDLEKEKQELKKHFESIRHKQKSSYV